MPNAIVLTTSAKRTSASGERELPERVDSKAVSGRHSQARLNQLRERLDLLAEEAKKRGFVYFRVDRRSNGVSIRMQFADGKGKFYERSVGLERLVKEQFGSPFLPVYSDIEDLVRSYVRNLSGIGAADHGMLDERVRATQT
jgi:hypothetical protein